MPQITIIIYNDSFETSIADLLVLVVCCPNAMVEMYMRKVLYEKKHEKGTFWKNMRKLLYEKHERGTLWKNMRKVCTFIKNLRKVLFKWRSWGKMCLTGSHSWYNNQVIMRKVFYKFLKWQIIFPYNFTLLSASPQVWKRTVLQIKIQPKKYSHALTTYFFKKYLKLNF